MNIDQNYNENKVILTSQVPADSTNQDFLSKFNKLIEKMEDKTIEWKIITRKFKATAEAFWKIDDKTKTISLKAILYRMKESNCFHFKKTLTFLFITCPQHREAEFFFSSPRHVEILPYQTHFMKNENEAEILNLSFLFTLTTMSLAYHFYDHVFQFNERSESFKLIEHPSVNFLLERNLAKHSEDPHFMVTFMRKFETKFIKNLFRIVYENSDEWMNFFKNMEICLDFIPKSSFLILYKKTRDSYIDDIIKELIQRRFTNLDQDYQDFRIVGFNIKTENYNNLKKFDLENILIKNKILKEFLDESSKIAYYIKLIFINFSDFKFAYDKQLNNPDSLEDYRLNSFIFNSVISLSTQKTFVTLKTLNQSCSVGEELTVEWNYRINFENKIQKSLDTYVSLMRFLMHHLENMKVIINTHEEIYKFLQFTQIYSYSVNVGEMHLVNALVVLKYLEYFIIYFNFTKYFHLVLEKYLILVIMLRMKFKNSPDHLFSPSLEFIKSKILLNCNVFNKSFYFVCLWRKGFICTLDNNSEEFKILLDLKLIFNKFYTNENNPNDFFNIINTISLIFDNLNKREKSEKLVYLQLLQVYLDNPEILKLVMKDEKLIQKITKRISRNICNGEFVIKKNDKINFFLILKSNLLQLFFKFINKLNLPIKEYFKLPKKVNYLNNENFIKYLTKKFENNFIKLTTIEPSYLVLRQIYSTYAAVEDTKNKKYNINLQNFLNSNFYYFDINTELFSKFNRNKSYLNDYKKSIEVFNEQKNENTTFNKHAIGLINNIEGTNKNQEVILREFSLLNLQNLSIMNYLIVQNILNPKKENESVERIRLLFNFLTDSENKRQIISVVSAIKLIDQILDEKETEFNEILKNAKYSKPIGKLLRSQENFVQIFKKKYTEVSNNKNHLNTAENLKKSYQIWTQIKKEMNSEKLIQNLNYSGMYKTCINFADEYVNRVLIEANKFKVEDFPINNILVNYFESYRRLDDNNYLIKNYILNKNLYEYFNQNTKKRIKTPFQEFCKEFFDRPNFVELGTRNYDAQDVKYGEQDENKVQIKSRTKLILSISILLFQTYKMINCNNLIKIEKLKKLLDYQTYMIIFKNFRMLVFRKHEIYTNVSLYKLYYELIMIIESISKFKLKNPLKNITEDFKTINLIEDLFGTRVLNRSYKNLNHLKLRRIICNLCNMKELEQKIIKEIMKIYVEKGEKKKHKVELYLNEYKNSYQDRNVDWIYTMLRYSLYLEDINLFKSIYKDITNYSNLDSKSHKIDLLNFKSKFYKNYLNQDVLSEIKMYLHNKGFESHLNIAIKSITAKVQLGNVFQNIKTISDQDLMGICNAVSYNIELTEKENKMDLDLHDNSLMNKTEIDEIVRTIFSLVFICIKSEEEKLLFKILPKTFNYLYKLHFSTKGDSSAIFYIKCICVELRSLSVNKINHIMPQLILANTEECNQDGHIYNLAVYLLVRICNEFPHQNAYWVNSFILQKENDSNVNNMKKLIFGNSIIAGLSPANKKILLAYKIFQEDLKCLVYVKDEKNCESRLRNKIKEINQKLMINKPDLLLPTLKNIRLDLNLFNNNAMTIVEHLNNKRIVKFNNEKEMAGGNSQLSLKLNNKDNNYSVFNNINQMINNNEIINYNKFQDEYIKQIDSEFEIMSSKDKPVKITFITNSDNKHHFMMKTDVGNDVIKEAKAMELLNTLNNIFSYEGLDQDFNVALRLYNLVPVANNVVVVEWLNQTTTIGDVLNDEYKRSLNSYTPDDLYAFKSKADKNEKSIEFYDKRLPDSSVLYKYFDRTYPDPNLWYDAKQKFIVSVASWSVSGLILGLSDRHNLNILIDKISGEVTHIDFGYLLWTGRKLAVPEKVDFRFTCNYRRALGLTEENGLFLQVFEQCFKAIVNNFGIIYPRLIAFSVNEK